MAFEENVPCPAGISQAVGEVRVNRRGELCSGFSPHPVSSREDTPAGGDGWCRVPAAPAEHATLYSVMSREFLLQEALQMKYNCLSFPVIKRGQNSFPLST